MADFTESMLNLIMGPEDEDFVQFMLNHANGPTDFDMFYGIELEVIVQSKGNEQASTWDGVAQQLSNTLAQEGIENEILDNSKTSDYKKWIISKDTSLLKEEAANTWGLELISSPTAPWDDSLSIADKAWISLTKNFDILESASCGTHVHISLYQTQGWEWGSAIETLKSVAKAAVYFERCIDALMPDHRLQNRYCKSNRYNSNFKSDQGQPYHMRDVFRMIDAIQGPKKLQELADLLCPGEEARISRKYRWNFTPLKRPSQNVRTIEFRQPPGCTDAFDPIFWPEFTMAFIYAVDSAAMGRNWPNAEDTATLSELEKLITTRLLYCNGLGLSQSAIMRFFEGKSQLPEGPFPEPPTVRGDPAQVNARERIEDEKLTRLEKFKE